MDWGIRAAGAVRAGHLHQEEGLAFLLATIYLALVPVLWLHRPGLLLARTALGQVVK
jgi:hypothetical protein